MTDETVQPADVSRRKILLGTAAAGVALAGGIPSAMAANKSAATRKEFDGKTAFITGSARGIGFACAQVLAGNGANIVLFDIAAQIETVKYPLATVDDLANARQQIESLGVKCLAIQGDVRDRKAIENAVAKTVSTFGSLDFVVVNAGITQVGRLEMFDDASVDTVLDVNLGGAIKTIQAVTAQLRKQKRGRIILMSSVTGRAGSSVFPVYSATKWGMIGLAKSTALALGKDNITCNAVCPTIVHTKLLDNEYILKALIPQNPTWAAMSAGAKQMRHILPVGGYEPVHIGNTVRFLCSAESELISGDVFDVGAGLNAQWPA
ncbi:SDR family NAD(P)-dependent oxidoreductase [Photobacterium sp. OFAV2-7]|uniref:SDR family NAD(P)-dependent oxidoreductase n=1 Tax=Photobacterium sp. OFAV2-7 TaxID=2917748 RepID=UPI001EF4C056|nr:SDR family NAD(P)-dependent oxidoreductase [Photobacterium sp. OFAV2-7]MCG7584320.1 SDR family NAD(P)-dependent oxidoreductase [Photobacterium sp. OFAV2-7]